MHETAQTTSLADAEVSHDGECPSECQLAVVSSVQPNCESSEFPNECQPAADSTILQTTFISTTPGKPQIGTLLEGRYKLLEKIGNGGMAEVFLAEHVTLGNMWAVKILPVSTDTLQEHLNEAGILKRLNHPMLPRITDIIQSASHICIIMDYLPGANLQDRLDVRGKFPEAEVRAWMGQICDVLAYLHGQKPEPVIYRDLKPSNLISDDHGHLKLIDFGTARNYRAGRDGDTAYIGTQGYASPEQYGLNQSDGRTDIYNLGMTMFHLLTGIHPVTIAHGDIRERLHDASVSDLLTAVLIRCVQLSPAKRYPDAQTCRIALMGTESALPEAAAIPETRADESIVAQKPDCKKDEHARKSSPILTGLLGKRSHPSIAERPSIPVQARIAVMGAFPGSGATFSSIALSAWFSSHGYSTACVEINPSGDMCRLQKTLELSGNIEAMAEDVDGRGSFQFRRVDYHKGCRRITDIRGQRYNVTVADMGSRNGSPALDEFLRADWQLVYCPHADWKFGRMEEFLERYDPDSDETQFHYLVPQDGDGCPASLRSLFGKRSVCAFPYIRNPFILAKAEDKLLERMFRCIGLTV